MTRLTFMINVIQGDLADFHGFNDMAETLISKRRGWIICELAAGRSVSSIVDFIVREARS